MRKTAGILVPLFSLRTGRSLGIGDIADLPDFARLASDAGQGLVQLLPLGELPDGESSPYSACTSFAIDPVYVAVDRLEDLREEERGPLLGPDGEATFARLRDAARVDYAAVRAVKRRLLRAAFDRFFVEQWEANTARAAALRSFAEAEAAWVRDYALYRAQKARYGEAWWLAWPAGVRERDATALERAGRELGREALYHTWVQWLAHEQWDAARKECNAMGVELMGDLPFIVGVDSADVWQHKGEFRRDYSLGVPGDALAPDGQDWGLPAYDWPAMDGNGLAWLRARGAHMGRLFDRFRVDHLVGYYRQYVRTRDDKVGRFVPDGGEPAWIARGEAVLSALIASTKGKVIAEDLGTIPPFVGASMKKLGLPGYKVIMWEHEEPSKWPYLSLATSGTHDTIAMITWWESLRYGERRGFLERIPSLRAVAQDHDVDKLSPRVHDALLDALYGAGSELTLLPLQDVLGWSDRVNVPGVTSSDNWSFRLPSTIDGLRHDGAVAHRLRVAGELAKKHGRA